MDANLSREHAALKMRAVAFAAKADAAISLAALLSDALQIQAALLQHADKLALQLHETTKNAQPAGGTVPRETSAPTGKDRHPPAGDGGAGPAPVAGPYLERNPSGV